MRDLDYCAPSTVEEAARLLRDAEGAIALAGGTDVVVARQAGRLDPALVVDITGLPGLDGLHEGPDGVTVGALMTMTALSRAPVMQERFAALAQAAVQMGCWQVRNLATLGGNLCNASPSADSAPPLLVYDAAVLVDGTGGPREMPMAGFFTGPGRTALERGELVVGVRLPPPPEGLRSVYVRRAIRRSMDIPLVNVAVALREDAGQVVDARIALGAVAPVPFRVPAAEEVLVGRPLSAEVVAEAAAAACCPASPIKDVRSTAEYRLAMVEVLVKRALERVAEVAA